MNTYKAEITDTYGGEANYGWVNRCKVEAGDIDQAVPLVKAELGLTGIKCDRETYGDLIVLKPRSMATIVFIEYDDE